jgi:hypothetical protein
MSSPHPAQGKLLVFLRKKSFEDFFAPADGPAERKLYEASSRSGN